MRKFVFIMDIRRRGNLSRTCCIRLVVFSVILTLLGFIIIADLQDNYSFYVHNYMQPSSKFFICVQQMGHFETDLFAFAFAFGLARENNRHVAIQKGSILQRYFKLPTTKTLKTMKVCTLFERKQIPQSWHYNKSEVLLDEWTHYYFVNGSGFVSVHFFDKVKDPLIKELTFVDESIRNVLVSKFDIHGNEYAKFHDVTEIVIYMADSSALENAFGYQYKESVKRYLLSAINYYSFRIKNARYLAVFQDNDFLRDIDQYLNISVINLQENAVYKPLSPGCKLTFLTSCDHVITSGAADMYGWWVGYLSQGEVMYPMVRTKGECQGSLCNLSAGDVYPHRWIGLTLE